MTKALVKIQIRLQQLAVKGEAGQGTLEYVGMIIVAVMVVALGVLVTKLGQATDQKSEVQSAADAAALAGAQEIRKEAPALILAAILAGGGGPLACGLGRGEASNLANRGRARVVQYCYYPVEDTVRVSVDSLANSAAGTPAHATAEAQLGLSLDSCVLPASPVPPTTAPPTPAPTVTSPPTTPPPPPPDVGAEVRCGELMIRIVFAGGSGVIKGLTEAKIRDLFVPFVPALKL